MQALATCDNGRAAGNDDIPFEAYKYGGETMVDALTILFTLAWEWELHPSAWDTANIIPLFKGGTDLCNVERYRAITLLNTANKIYEAFLLHCITTILDKNSSLSPSQGGFRPGVGPQETVYGLLSLLLHRQAKKQPSYVAFVDFETAFPTTFKPVVWKNLHQHGIRGPLWRNTRNLYANVKGRVLHPLIPDDEFFDIPQGLREGSKLSPLLFNLAVNDMRAHFRWHPQGPLGVTMTTNICEEFAGVWQYADDVALVASSPYELQNMIKHLQIYL
jgi:hypothetical protein